MNDFVFDRVVPSDQQVAILYDLLTRREHRISHTQNPSFRQHKDFVDNNPYRSWYIVRTNGTPLGSFYVSNENTIGINVSGGNLTAVVHTIIEFVLSKYEPLEPIPSVRNGCFAINVAPSDKSLIDALTELNCKPAQVSYYLPSN